MTIRFYILQTSLHSTFIIFIFCFDNFHQSQFTQISFFWFQLSLLTGRNCFFLFTLYIILYVSDFTEDYLLFCLFVTELLYHLTPSTVIKDPETTTLIRHTFRKVRIFLLGTIVEKLFWRSSIAGRRE